MFLVLTDNKLIMINTNLLPSILLFLTLGLALVVEMMVLPNIIRIAREKNLFDLPDKRKSHNKLVPRLAGISFFPILMFVVSVCILAYLHVIQYHSGFSPQPEYMELFAVVGGNLLLFGIGIKDDLIGARNWHKMIIQFLAAVFLVTGGVYINDFNGLFGLGAIPLWIGVPFTIGLVMFITNAVNLIDGADGLASGISGVALTALGVLFYLRGMFFYSVIAAALVGILIPFFYYNVFHPSHKIFMGDTGSLTLGFQLSYLAVRFSMNAPLDYTYFSAPTILALSCLFIPVFDALRVMVARFCAGVSMFLPDRRHIHHKLLDLGFSHRKVMVSLVISAGVLIFFNMMLLRMMNVNVVFSFDIIIWLGLVMTLNILIRRKVSLISNRITE